MKVLGYVLAILFFLGSSFVGCAGASKSFELADQLDEATAGMSAAEKQLVDGLSRSSLGAELPSSGRLNAGAMIGFVATVAGLALVVIMFARRRLVVPFAVAAVAIAAIAIFVYPVVPTSGADGMAPRPQQIVATVLAAISAGGALLARWAIDKRAGARAAAV